MSVDGTTRAGSIMNGLAGLILLIAFVVGAYVYPQLPDVVVTHWDASGEPDGFRNKSFWSIFGLLTFGVMTVVALAALDLLFVRRSERLVAAERSLYSVGIGYLNLSTVLLFTWLSMLSWFDRDPGPLLIAFVLLSSLPLLALIGFYFPAVTQQRKAQLAPDEPSLDPAHWRLGGFFYSNPDDPRVFVPKPPHTGTGLTVNMATRGGRLFMIGMVVFLVATLVLTFTL